MYKTWQAGATVKTKFGEIRKVLRQEGCLVLFTNGEASHPNNLQAV